MRGSILSSIEANTFLSLYIYGPAWISQVEYVRREALRASPTLDRRTEAADDFGAFAHDLAEGQRSRRDLEQLDNRSVRARVECRRAHRDVGGRDVDLLGQARASLGIRAHLQRRRNEAAIAVTGAGREQNH